MGSPSASPSLHHRDPFDRLLIAQARQDGLTLVTADTRIHAYDVARPARVNGSFWFWVDPPRTGRVS